MLELMRQVVIDIVVFAATNLDDLLVLVALFSSAGFRGREVAVGQFLGIGALVLVSGVAALIALVIPGAYIRLLGLVPIFLGLRQLLAASSGPDKDAALPPRGSGMRRVLAVAVVTIANGGDNLSVYTPFFAVRDGFWIALAVVVFAAMTAIWLILARWLVRHSALGRLLLRYEHRLLPGVFILLGVFILSGAGA